MEVDEIQVRKFQRIGSNGRSSSGAHHDDKVVPPQPQKAAEYHHHDPDDEEDGLSVSLVKQQRSSNGGGGGTGLDIIGAGARFSGWPSSRIVRVSRASGGKDRHSKVLTSKGLRDRRVRLSVTTAIQFYDLQDRLGYDQPSKAVEWLLKAASSSISELPSLNPSFPETPKSDENHNKRSSEHNSEHGFDESHGEQVELDGDPNNSYLQQQQQQQQGFSNSKSACSSTSETSKGSGGLSLSRSESRIRARERARERAAEKEKEKDNESSHHGGAQQNVSSISPNNSSFTELLTAGISSNNSPNGGGGDDSNLAANKSRGGQWSTSSPIPMEYLSAGGMFGGPRGQTSSGFSGHITQLGNNNTIPHFGDHHQNLHHFSFVPENFIPVATSVGAGECAYNLNFSISSTTTSAGLAGYNRGTLQSNSSQPPSLLHPHYNIQRFPSIDGSNLPFFIGTTTSSAAAAVAAAPPVDHNQHHPQFPNGFDARLQLCYGDAAAAAAARHSDHKGKGK